MQQIGLGHTFVVIKSVGNVISCGWYCLCCMIEPLSLQMEAVGGALPLVSVCSIKKSWIPNKRFYCMATSEGCDLLGYKRSLALRLAPCSSLFSCQGCHIQHTKEEHSFATARLGEKKRLKSCLQMPYCCSQQLGTEKKAITFWVDGHRHYKINYK